MFLFNVSRISWSFVNSAFGYSFTLRSYIGHLLCWLYNFKCQFLFIFRFYALFRLTFRSDLDLTALFSLLPWNFTLTQHFSSVSHQWKMTYCVSLRVASKGFYLRFYSTSFRFLQFFCLNPTNDPQIYLFYYYCYYYNDFLTNRLLKSLNF